MNKIRNQKGFAILELLLIAIIVLGLGGIGWYVINSNNKTKNQLDKLAKASDTATKSSKSSSKPSTAASSELVFKELGVQMILPASLKGLTYNVDNGYLYLADDAFIAALKKCSDYKSGEYGGGFTAIGKKSGQYPADPNPIDDGALLKQFPDFYINFGVPNGNACSDLSQSDNLKIVADQERTNFINAFQKTGNLVQ